MAVLARWDEMIDCSKVGKENQIQGRPDVGMVKRWPDVENKKSYRWRFSSLLLLSRSKRLP